jgi:hypothetical protein
MPTSNTSQIFTLSLQLSTLYSPLVLGGFPQLLPCFWGIICFLGGIFFHKIKGRETLSRSFSNLNTADHNLGLTESFSTSAKLLMGEMDGGRFKIFHFHVLLIFKYYFLTVLGQNHM